jgi:hypothetical protein
MILIMTLLMLWIGIMMFSGCDWAYQYKADATVPLITPEQYAQLTPPVQAQYRKVRIIDQKTVRLLDQGEATSQTLISVITPFASAIPYGTLLLGILGGMATTWRKVRSTIALSEQTSTAFREIVEGIQNVKNSDGIIPPEADILSSLSSSMSRVSKNLVKETIPTVIA